MAHIIKNMLRYKSAKNIMQKSELSKANRRLEEGSGRKISILQLNILLFTTEASYNLFTIQHSCSRLQASPASASWHAVASAFPPSS